VIDIDREKASRLGVQIDAIDNVLYDSFGQRQISIIFTQLNQFWVVLEAAPEFRNSPSVLDKIYVNAAGDAQLLFLGHRRAGALLAVAHGGVEYDQVLFHGDAPSQIGAMRPEVTSPHLPGAANRVLPNWDWRI
jgi:multidrug efflux pump subunit AcrB